MERVWFITGSSRGFGRELVGSALQAGDLVAATARRPEQLTDLVDAYGERILPLTLDVTDASAARSAIAAARERFGRIDVVVNNAGYANVCSDRKRRRRQLPSPNSRRTSGVSTTSRKPRIPVLREQQGGLMAYSVLVHGWPGRRFGRDRLISGRPSSPRDRRVLAGPSG